jgi:hypothetical protein
MVMAHHNAHRAGGAKRGSNVWTASFRPLCSRGVNGGAMIGAVLALALQAIGADAAAAASPAGGPDAQTTSAQANAADAIADILANTPPDAAPPTPMPPAESPPPPLPGPTVEERAQMYESGVRSSFQARESRQGPLDGRWVLTDADGKSLFMLQLTDPGVGRGPVEGAWRDMERQGAVGASGFLTSADRSGPNLVLKFEEGDACVVTLAQGADGRWTGALRVADHSRPVVMTRS